MSHTPHLFHQHPHNHHDSTITQRRNSRGVLQRGLSRSSARKPSICQDAYVGIAFRLKTPQDEEALRSYKEEYGTDKPVDVREREIGLLKEGWSLLTFFAILSDGVGTIDNGNDSMVIDLRSGQGEGRDDWKEARRVASKIIDDLTEVAEAKSLVIQVLAISEPLPAPLHNCPILLPLLYSHLNCIPFLIPSPTFQFTSLPAPSPEYSSSSAVSLAIKSLHNAIHSAVTVELDKRNHKVLVDDDGRIQIACLRQYEESTSEVLWKRFMALVRHVKGNGIKFVRVSATPQGGGVALLQNALVRLWRLLDIDGFWLVPEGHPAVFDITKRKFHNVLQGVQQNKLTDEDKAIFENWTEANFELFWSGTASEGPTFEEDRICVVDDPQLAALIPLLKKKYPKIKIAFRSHIQIQSDLADDPSTECSNAWNYLFSFVKQTDLFIAHPVDFFVPKNVKDHLPVVYMPPSTDPLDGLNKPIGRVALNQLREVYNSLSRKQCKVEVDWTRGYIIQVARFDPSKGLPCLLASYLAFRNKLREEETGEEEKKPPMLVVVGHGSQDDPDGTSIYEQLHEIVNSADYGHICRDISIVRAPPSDTLLGALMQGAWCATQLSTREGFESKVSEAVLKRIPIIASTAGGIPLQVKPGVNGWLVAPDDSEAVAEILYKLHTGKIKLNRTESPRDETAALDQHLDPNATADLFVRDIDAPQPKVHPDDAAPSEDFFTIGNAARWLLLFSLLCGKPLNPENHSKERGGLGDAEIEMLEGMGLNRRGTKGGKEGMAEFGDRNVWEMLMQEDKIPGEGRIKLKSEGQ